MPRSIEVRIDACVAANHDFLIARIIVGVGGHAVPVPMHDVWGIPELFLYICGFLDDRDFARMRRVSLTFRAFASDEPTWLRRLEACLLRLNHRLGELSRCYDSIYAHQIDNLVVHYNPFCLSEGVVARDVLARLDEFVDDPAEPEQCQDASYYGRDICSGDLHEYSCVACLRSRIVCKLHGSDVGSDDLSNEENDDDAPPAPGGSPDGVDDHRRCFYCSDESSGQTSWVGRWNEHTWRSWPWWHNGYDRHG